MIVKEEKIQCQKPYKTIVIQYTPCEPSHSTKLKQTTSMLHSQKRKKNMIMGHHCKTQRHSYEHG